MRTWIPIRQSQHVAIALLTLLFVALPVAAQLNPYNPYIGGKNKVRWDKFEWYTYDTPHFRISYYDRVEPSLEKIASYAESAYDDIARKLNFQILKPVPMICYATHAEFEQTNIIVGFIPEGVGAFATPVRNRMVLPVDLPDRELQALIQHELTHIFQYEIFFGGSRGRAIYARPPLWFMEGMASYFGDDEDSRDEMYMRDAALSDQVPSIMRPPRDLPEDSLPIASATRFSSTSRRSGVRTWSAILSSPCAATSVAMSGDRWTRSSTWTLRNSTPPSAPGFAESTSRTAIAVFRASSGVSFGYPVF